MTRIANIVKNWKPQEGKGDITAIQLTKAYENSFSENTEGGITALSVTKNDLVTLELGDDAQALTYLYLSGNKSLKKVTLVSLPKLTHLYLDNCALEEITIPSGCNELKQIYLQKNQLKKIVFEGDCLRWS